MFEKAKYYNKGWKISYHLKRDRLLFCCNLYSLNFYTICVKFLCQWSFMRGNTIYILVRKFLNFYIVQFLLIYSMFFAMPLILFFQWFFAVLSFPLFLLLRYFFVPINYHFSLTIEHCHGYDSLIAFHMHAEWPGPSKAFGWLFPRVLR